MVVRVLLLLSQELPLLMPAAVGEDLLVTLSLLLGELAVLVGVVMVQVSQHQMLRQALRILVAVAEEIVVLQ